MAIGNFSFGRPGSRVRSNRIKVGTLGGLLVCAALAFGVVVGSGSNAGPPYEEAAVVFAMPDGLSNHQLSGQRFVAGFTGTSVPSDVKKAIRSGRLGGIILFADNVPTKSAARRVTRQLRQIKRPAALRKFVLPVMIDQEGGLVKRLSGAPAVSAEIMGRRGPAFARRQGKLTGLNLSKAGININLAPVLDVARPGGNIAADDRGFGRTAKRVSATAIPFTKGLQANGVAATAKHFPGLGDVMLNTDDATQKIRLSRRTLRKVDEAPYKPFIRAGGELVMVGTAIYPALGPKPAAFEKKVVQGELRNRLGFKGVTITDSLEAVAAKEFGSSKRVSIAGARAGMDMLLFGSLDEALKGENALAKRLKAGTLDRDDFEAAVGRILRLRDKLSG